MRIAVIGAGNVGGTLARRLAIAGHEIVIGARDPSNERTRALLAELPEASRPTARSIARAAEAADVVLLATPWGGAEEALRAVGDLGGRILIDCTNPLRPDLSLMVGHDTSGGEIIARMASGARVVKAFNTTGFSNMADPSYGASRLAMFVCGDDADARATVLALAEQIGFEGVDCGPLANARLLEPVAALWIWLAYSGGRGLDFAFALPRR
jgi:NADPH-dependent F420 reductase